MLTEDTVASVCGLYHALYLNHGRVCQRVTREDKPVRHNDVDLLSGRTLPVSGSQRVPQRLHCSAPRFMP